MDCQKRVCLDNELWMGLIGLDRIYKYRCRISWNKCQAILLSVSRK